MQRSVNLLVSLPVPVRFAGFESDTTKLQGSGWQLSVEQERHERTNGTHLRLVGKFEQGGLYFYTGIVELNPALLYARTNNPYQYIELIREHGFDVMHVGSDIRIISDIKPKFFPIDARPGELLGWDSPTTQYSLADMANIFKPINPDAKELIVDPNDVQALMKQILKVQKPKQAEIIKKARNKQFLDSAEGFGYDHTKDIQLQIVSMTG